MMKTITLSNSIQLPYNFTGSVEYLNISKYWYKEDKLHREDGPAVELVRGQKEWYKEGKLHRIDGPAVEWGLVTPAIVTGKQIGRASCRERV